MLPEGFRLSSLGGDTMRIQGYEQLDRRIPISKLAKVNGQTFAKGEVIKGEILDIQQKSALIKLESGMKMMATLTQDMELSIDQKLLFQVKDANMDQVILKPMLDALFNPKDAKLMQALDQAGVTPNDKNMEIVHELINRNMPVDKNTLNQVMRLAYKFQDVSLDKLLLMVQKNIPVTKENIDQLNNLIQHQNGIKQEIMNLGEELLQAATKDGDTGKELMRILTTPIDTPPLQQEQSGNSVVVGGEVNVEEQPGASQDALPEATTKAPTSLTNLLPEQIITQINEEVKAMLGHKVDSFKPLTGEMTIEQLEAWVADLDLDEDDKSSVNKSITSKVMEGAIDKNMLLDGNALKDLKLVKNYYHEVYDRLVQLIQSKAAAGEKNGELLKSAGKVKQNIEFMHHINQNYQYVQLPLGFSQNIANSELYIFENKKELKSKGKNDAVSALLRLDYLNLGHLDIYVKKQGKMVECKFYVEDELKRERVNNHVHKLSKSLDNYGYKITGMSVSLQHDKFSVMEEFLQRKDESAGVKRYSFDMRV